MTKICFACHQPYNLTAWECSYYERIGVPVTTECSYCRLQRRLAWRNEQRLYQRHCDLCQTRMISLYPTGTIFPVYCKDCWWSDKWTALDYGQIIDWDQPFFKQFGDLLKRVPRLGLIVSHGENSDYCTYSVYYKNCYMCVSGVVGENNLYCYFMNDSRDCVDSGTGFNCEQLYECLDCHNLYHSQFCVDCENSSDLFMCTDLVGCTNCIGCVGLRHKQYYVYNQAVSKEEYERTLAQVKSNWSELNAARQRHIALLKVTPQPYRRAKSVERCSGDHVYNSMDAQEAFDATNLDHAAYVWNIPQGGRDIVDANYSPNCELVYNVMSAVNVNQGIGLYTCWDTSFTDYSAECFYGSNLFGCVGVRQGKYVILNKTYSEDDFIMLRQRLIEHMNETGEWGQFFPMALSPFAYNETVAFERWPLSRDQVTQLGGSWREEPNTDNKIKSLAELPDIKLVTDDILKISLRCDSCGKPYKFVKQELAFYRQQQLPLPTWCPSCRYQSRMSRRNPTRLWNRGCMCTEDTHDHAGPCLNQFKTTYAPDREQIVYCERCYQQAVY